VRADDGAGALGRAVAAVEELPGGVEERVDALEQLAVGDLAPPLAPAGDDDGLASSATTIVTGTDRQVGRWLRT
jgi:hypothetical protein